jgi:hypothetical protein
MSTIKYVRTSPGAHDRTVVPDPAPNRNPGFARGTVGSLGQRISAHSTGQGSAAGDGATTDRTQLDTNFGKPRR